MYAKRPLLLGSLLVLALTSTALAQPASTNIGLADGKLQLKADSKWVRKQPQVNMIEHEFAAPASKGDTIDGRLTIMSATGGIEANIDRWIGQFVQPDGSSTRDKSKVKKSTVAGEDVHMVDISGTYKDQAGPMAGAAIDRPKFRMLGAIIATKSNGTYFVKFYGPEQTIGDNQAAFIKMIEGLEKK